MASDDRIVARFSVYMTDPIPVSVNELYTTFRGKRVLNKAGREFKEALKKKIVEATMPLDWKGAFDAVYLRGAGVRVDILLHGKLFNDSWEPGKGTSTAKGELRNPYKKKDGPNYMKVIEDAIAEGTGIDDSVHLSSCVHKVPGPIEYVEIYYEVFHGERTRCS